jgi:outer membrane protein OmpA-like peptidoglycan-associated protein/tetratricopeptide (TPR) repeat protein
MRNLFMILLLCALCGRVAGQAPATASSGNAAYSLKAGDENFNLYKYNEALEYYLAAYKKGTASFYLTQQIAKSYRLLYDYKNALEWYDKLYGFKTDNTAENLKEYAQLLKNAEQYDRAVQVYGEYVSRTGGNEMLSEYFASTCVWAKQNIGAASKYGAYPTSIAKGKLHLGMTVYNNGLMVSVPKNSGADEKTVYYNLAYVKSQDTLIFAKPEELEGDVHATYYEAGPALSPDGKTLYYTRNSTDASTYKPKKASKYNIDKNGSSNLQIFSSRNNNGAWTKGRPLNVSSLDYNCVFPCVSSDGKALYFCSNMPGGSGGYDIYKAEIVNDTMLGRPLNLGPEINTIEDDLYPYVTKEHFYYSSRGKNGFGGLDIQKAQIVNGSVVNPQNMGVPFNSSKDDFSILFKEGGKQGYFVSNREGDHGGDIVWYFNKLLLWDTIKGTVIDRITAHAIEGVKVTLYEIDAKGNKVFVKDTLTGKDGNWLFITDPEKAYRVAFQFNNYDSKEFYIPEKDLAVKPSRRDVIAMLNPMNLYPTVKKDNVVKIDNIYFDFDKATIRAESYGILDNLVNFLKENAMARIELSAHTDAAGNDKYNLKLSDGRAKSCFDYLVAKGIDPSRLIPKGYGETRLLNNCKDAKKCSEAENQLNRRVEVKFL